MLQRTSGKQGHGLQEPLVQTPAPRPLPQQQQQEPKEGKVQNPPLEGLVFSEVELLMLHCTSGKEGFDIGKPAPKKNN